MNKFMILTIIFFSLIENKLFSMIPPHLRKQETKHTFRISQSTNNNNQTTKNNTEYPIECNLLFKSSMGPAIVLETNFKADKSLPTDNIKKQLASKIGCDWNNITLFGDCGAIITTENVTIGEFMNRACTHFKIKENNSK